MWHREGNLAVVGEVKIFPMGVVQVGGSRIYRILYRYLFCMTMQIK